MMKGLLFLAISCVAAGDPAADVVPQPAAFAFKPGKPEALYYPAGPVPAAAGHHHDHHSETDTGTMPWTLGVPDADLGREAYPYVESGEIRPPRSYDALAKFSKADVDRIRRGLVVARRYADVNNAFADGYRMEGKFDPGMGIHTYNLGYILSGEVEIEKPQFLTYVLNRRTRRLQLVQMGYMRRAPDGKPYKLFDAPEAGGHFHAFDICARVDRNIFSYKPDKECSEKGDVKVGPLWMLHFAVNIYNENGMFADAFPYANYLSSRTVTRSFYGALVER